jgi:hypothetical protein
MYKNGHLRELRKNDPSTFNLVNQLAGGVTPAGKKDHLLKEV